MSCMCEDMWVSIKSVVKAYVPPRQARTKDYLNTISNKYAHNKTFHGQRPPSNHVIVIVAVIDTTKDKS